MARYFLVLIRLAFEAAGRVSESKWIVTGVSVQIPTLRGIGTLVQERLIRADVPAQRTIEIPRPKVIKALPGARRRLRVSRLPGELLIDFRRVRITRPSP